MSDKEKKVCPNIEKCPMYKKFTSDRVKRMYINYYCEGDFERCQRKKIRDRGEVPPDALLPDGVYLP